MATDVRLRVARIVVEQAIEQAQQAIESLNTAHGFLVELETEGDSGP